MNLNAEKYGLVLCEGKEDLVSQMLSKGSTLIGATLYSLKSVNFSPLVAKPIINHIPKNHALHPSHFQHLAL